MPAHPSRIGARGEAVGAFKKARVYWHQANHLDGGRIRARKVGPAAWRGECERETGGVKLQIGRWDRPWHAEVLIVNDLLIAIPVGVLRDLDRDIGHLEHRQPLGEVDIEAAEEGAIPTLDVELFQPFWFDAETLGQFPVLRPTMTPEPRRQWRRDGVGESRAGKHSA